MVFDLFVRLLKYHISDNSDEAINKLSYLGFDFDKLACELYTYKECKEFEVVKDDDIMKWFALSVIDVVNIYYIEYLTDFDEFVCDVLICVDILYAEYFGNRIVYKQM